MSNYVFVLNANKQPLDPIHPAQARLLLSQGKAAVFRCYPFTLIVKEEIANTSTQPLEVKLDPGSKVTGISILCGSKVIFASELTHRGQVIKKSLESRRAIRRGRRGRKTRYRQARFLNRKRPKGWLAPSLKHRVLTTLTLVKKLIRLAPVASLVQELVRFDLQKEENPEIAGIEYQQGTLHGYETREYLLNKWNRTCAYCKAKDVPLQIEHIQPKSRGGSNRLSNLCLACEPCNIKKGVQDIKDFLKGKPTLLKSIQAQAKRPLKDAAAVNSTRWALFNALKATGLPVSVGSGGQTKFNRVRMGLTKEHWIDSACVGSVDRLDLKTSQPLRIKCAGHGTRQMCRTDRFGFPSRHVPRFKPVKGFRTGDIVKATVLKGKKEGIHVGRVAVRSTGSFNISTKKGLVQGISHNYCQIKQKKDGYSYGF